MKINEVSKKFNVTSDTLRYWERVGAIPRVSETKPVIETMMKRI
ncbi:MerR family DNA-binding transcriptional regulator [Lentilactobacillus parakefiri]|nr:MerR family DNA-binding transcriptional regulator [Lentilactobacillus parakefiri]